MLPRYCFHACFAQRLTAEKMPVTPLDLPVGPQSRALQHWATGLRVEAVPHRVKRVTANVPGACSELHVLLRRGRSHPRAACKGKTSLRAAPTCLVLSDVGPSPSSSVVTQ